MPQRKREMSSRERQRQLEYLLDSIGSETRKSRSAQCRAAPSLDREIAASVVRAYLQNAG